MRRMSWLAAVGSIGLASTLMLASPLAAEEAVLARTMPVNPSPALASPAAGAAHYHHLATPVTPLSEPRPGIGTPVSEGGLVVTLDAGPLQSGPTDLTVTVMDETGAPVSAARVVLFSEMAEMSADSRGSLLSRRKRGAIASKTFR